MMEWKKGKNRNLGQATVEYMIILTLAVIVSTTVTRKILLVLDSGTLRIGAGLEKQLKTGRMPASSWSN